MKTLNKILIIIAACATIIPLIYTQYIDVEFWIKESIYHLAILFTLEFIVLITLFFLPKTDITPTNFLLFAMPILFSAAITMNITVFNGIQQAEFSTWHLILIFGPIYQVFFTGIVFFILLILWLFAKQFFKIYKKTKKATV